MRGMTLSVSQLNEYVRRTLASDPVLHNVCITGELSNLKRHVSGHWYFTLKDEEAAVNCAMFRTSAMGLRFRPENGQRVRVYGSVGLYAKTGSYQFYVDSMEPDGLGDLYLRFEALKRKLNGEGVFDASRKKPLPLLPKGIGIATSKTGAVVHDIARVAWRRFPNMPLYLCPVKVQGEGAADEIAQALRLLDSMEEVDVIIVGRGGGSMEDLWAFNEEIVARAIAECQTPVVSAVGHETDFTIADFTADLRAPTPSAAAELAVPLQTELEHRTAILADRLTYAAQRQLAAKRLALHQYKARLTALAPERRGERMRAALHQAQMRLHTLMQSALAARAHQVQRAALRLKTAGPEQTLRRGYAVVMREDGLIRSAASVSAGDRLRIRFADGSVEAVAESTKMEKDES